MQTHSDDDHDASEDHEVLDCLKMENRHVKLRVWERDCVELTLAQRKVTFA